MFIQIHMLQSMPPGNLNRDDTGQPKKCLFGGVTRGRISSQCLKRNIRHSAQFKDTFGDALAIRTVYLPRMVADALKDDDIDDSDLDKIKKALGRKFKSEKTKGEDDQDGDDSSGDDTSSTSEADKTGQLVFIPPPFAKEIASLITDFKGKNQEAYKQWCAGEKSKKAEEKKAIENLEKEIFKASHLLSVDIALFGRMTTSDLVVNVEAACQVAHAISTHETLIESDYFTAMDEKKVEYALTQTDATGAGFLGSGETETFFNSSVYYKYFNIDIDAFQKHLSWDAKKTADAVGAFVRAAALANPTGKQNSFAAHGVPELILVEVSEKKQPISYANAFLQPVKGSNLMAGSALALAEYVNSVATAFVTNDMCRCLLVVGSATEAKIDDAQFVKKLDDLVACVTDTLKSKVAV